MTMSILERERRKLAEEFAEKLYLHHEKRSRMMSALRDDRVSQEEFEDMAYHTARYLCDLKAMSVRLRQMKQRMRGRRHEGQDVTAPAKNGWAEV